MNDIQLLTLAAKDILVQRYDFTLLVWSERAWLESVDSILDTLLSMNEESIDHIINVYK